MTGANWMKMIREKRNGTSLKFRELFLTLSEEIFSQSSRNLLIEGNWLNSRKKISLSHLLKNPSCNKNITATISSYTNSKLKIGSIFQNTIISEMWKIMQKIFPRINVLKNRFFAISRKWSTKKCFQLVFPRGIFEI